MSTLASYYQAIETLNNRMWAQAKPLEQRLRDLEIEYRATADRPITDVISTGVASILLGEMNATSANLNGVYDDWQRNLSLITPPPPTDDPNAFPPKPSRGKPSAKIPWPKDVPMEVRRQLGRVIDQGGIPISKRVQIIPAKGPYGGGGVAIEFSKW